MAPSWLPAGGGFVGDDRGPHRTLRVSHHPDEGGLVVLSLWRGSICTATFRLRADEVEDLVTLLRAGDRDTIGVASQI